MALRQRGKKSSQNFSGNANKKMSQMGQNGAAGNCGAVAGI
jgi:hypothetical protein